LKIGGAEEGKTRERGCTRNEVSYLKEGAKKRKRGDPEGCRWREKFRKKQSGEVGKEKCCRKGELWPVTRKPSKTDERR